MMSHGFKCSPATGMRPVRKFPSSQTFWMLGQSSFRNSLLVSLCESLRACSGNGLSSKGNENENSGHRKLGPSWKSPQSEFAASPLQWPWQLGPEIAMMWQGAFVSCCVSHEALQALALATCRSAQGIISFDSCCACSC